MAETLELGKGYVQIVPRAKGIKSAIQKELGIDGSQVGTKMGGNIMTGLGSGLKAVGGKFTSWITKPALAATAGLAAAAVFKGWKRVTELDAARGKLEAIGKTGKEVASIEKSALASVKGTAFAANEAMTAAASASAAGVKTGKDMTKYLSSVADAAAVAGTSMDDMGYIFNSVATKNKASNKELKQMAQRGIPIYQYLADTLGVTSEKVFDMAKSGEIDLADFRKAIEKNIGGAAKEMGWKTINGAIDNTMAALARAGEALFGNKTSKNATFAELIIPRLRSLVDYIDNVVTPKMTELGDKIRDAFLKVEGVLGQFSPGQLLAGFGALVALGPALSMIGNIFTAWHIIGPIFTGIGTAISGILPIFGTLITGVLHPIMAGLPMLQYALGGIGPLISSIGAALTSPVAIGIMAVGAITAIVAASKPLRTAIMDLAKAVFPAIMGVMNAVKPIISALVSELWSIAKTIGDNLAPIIKQLQPVLVGVFNAVAGFIKSAAPWIVGFIKTTGALIKSLVVIVSGTISAVITIIGKVAKTVMALPKTISKAWNTIKAATSKTWTAVCRFITTPFRNAWNTVKAIVTTIKDAVKFSGLSGIVKGVWNHIKDAISRPIQAAKDKVKGIIDAIKGFFHFSVPTPHIPLPHFSLQPAGWKIGDLVKGKIPSLGVSWYAKGGIVDDATLIGAGEAGSEAIVPLDPFWKKLENMNAGKNETYNITVNVDAQDLDGVMSVKDFVTMLQRAKAIA